MEKSASLNLCKQTAKKDPTYRPGSPLPGHQTAYKKWTDEENMLYAKFLLDNIDEFSGDDRRRSMKFFSRMAECMLFPKNNLQCRSHHQKMMIKYKTVEKIIEVFLPKAVKIEEPAPIKVENTQVKTEEPAQYVYFYPFLPFHLMNEEGVKKEE